MSIRSEFVVQNIFSHIIQNKYRFITLPPCNILEKKFLTYKLKVIDEFEPIADIRKLCLEVDINDTTLRDTISEIGIQVFADGINKYRILVFIIFVAELCLLKDLSPIATYSALWIFFQCNLESWIKNHDGWVCMICLVKLCVRTDRGK